MDNNNNHEIVKYNITTDTHIEVRVFNDTVWLSQSQMAELFGTKRQAITKHLKQIFNSKELSKEATCSILELVQKEGNRQVSRQIEHFNLDVIISVGYRVNTIQGIQFRQWASQILKNHFLHGNTIINRFEKLENRIAHTEKQIRNLIQTALPPKYCLFYDGQTFDAYVFVAELLKNATIDIKLVDNYVDESTLLLLNKRKAHTSTTIFTEKITDVLNLDLKKYNSQYHTIKIIPVSKIHDRFLIIDNKDLYHFGASIKDLGKKLFMVSKIEDPEIIQSLINKLNSITKSLEKK